METNNNKLIIKGMRIEEDVKYIHERLKITKRLTDNDLMKILIVQAYRFIDINKPLTYKDMQDIDYKFSVICKGIRNEDKKIRHTPVHDIDGINASGDMDSVNISTR